MTKVFIATLDPVDPYKTFLERGTIVEESQTLLGISASACSGPIYGKLISETGKHYVLRNAPNFDKYKAEAVNYNSQLLIFGKKKEAVDFVSSYILALENARVAKIVVDTQTKGVLQAATELRSECVKKYPDKPHITFTGRCSG